MTLVQCNNAGFGTINELDKFNLTELKLMLRYKAVWQEWSENNNGRR